MHVFRWTYRQTGYTTEIIANVTSEILIIQFYHFLQMYTTEPRNSNKSFAW